MPSWRTPMGGLLRFGLFATLVQIVAYVGNNAHNVILGRSYDASQLGYYSRAYQLYMVPTIQVLGPLTSVAHPLLSRMQDDHRSLAKTLPTLGSILGYPIALLCAVIAAAPNPVVQVLLGSQWAESANILGILSIGGAVLGLNRVLVWCHQALGLNRQLFVSFLLSRTLMVSGMWMAADDGLDSVAVAFTAMVVISWPMNSYALHARGVLDHRYWLVSIRILLLATMLFLAARTCAILTEDLSAIAQLFAISLSAVAVTLVAGIARPFRRDFQTILSVLR